MNDTTYTNRDGLSTSWGADQDTRWDTFRNLVLEGVDPTEAAHRAGLDD